MARQSVSYLTTRLLRRANVFALFSFASSINSLSVLRLFCNTNACSIAFVLPIIAVAITVLLQGTFDLLEVS